ncbi:hypothetical protein AB9P05_17335 [Roseivirga sp. BDSF3-8]|uniref:hypothetical protein n=1 Tax=Roseivirga sp. BDSF3-8 TaxID=3241598 RepID=UPI0035325708
MSDKVATFWIITGQNDVYELGDSPRPDQRTFTFQLTEEPYNSWGYITLMVRNVTWEHNRVYINDNYVGNLDVTPGNHWCQQTLIVEVTTSQKFGEGTNRLKIESRTSDGGTGGNNDDFEVKHLIFGYRTNR